MNNEVKEKFLNQDKYLNDLMTRLCRIESHYNQHIMKDHTDTLMPIPSACVVENSDLSLVARLQANLNMYIRKCDDLRLQHMEENEKHDQHVTCLREALNNMQDCKNKFQGENKELQRKLKANEQLSRCHAESCQNLRNKLEDKNGTINWQAGEIDKLRDQLKELEQININLVNKEPIMERSDIVLARPRFDELKNIEKKYNSLVLAVLKSKED